MTRAPISALDTAVPVRDDEVVDFLSDSVPVFNFPGVMTVLKLLAFENLRIRLK